MKDNVLKKLLKTLQNNAVNNECTISNVDLFVKSWQREMDNEPLPPSTNKFVSVKLKKEVMTEFEKNHPTRLIGFLKGLEDLIDEYHADICLLDEVFEAKMKIEVAISDELNKNQ
tara:strand:+ start:254 stop:598 length:345 start_codon:yes stop_codon:yes gene_type:complete